MKIKIDDYRKFEIFFDTDSEDFYTVSNQHDTENKKRSYASTKKWIDEYLKENEKFVPFMVQRVEYSGLPCGKPFLITGMRKDGKFVKEDGGSVSGYDEKDHVLHTDQLYDISKMAAKIDAEIAVLYTKKKKLVEGLETTNLQEYRKILNPNL